MAIRCRAFPRVGEAIVRAQMKGQTLDIDPGYCPLCSTPIDSGWEWAHLLVSCQDQPYRLAQAKWLDRVVPRLETSLCTGQAIDNLPLNTGVSSWNRPRLGAVAIYLAGGVVNDDFDNATHLGFGQLPLTLTLSQQDFGPLWVLTASFLQTVAPLYAEHLHARPDESSDYGAVGEQVAELGDPPPMVED